MSPEFLVGIRRVVEEPSLFSHDVAAWLQALRPLAGSGIGRAVLDNVHLLSAEEANGFTVVQEAVKAALVDRANRGARQHSIEWEAFMLSLGPNSFLADWALRGRA